MVIVDDGVTYAVPHLPQYQGIDLPLTRDEFEDIYNIWCCGGSYHALAAVHRVKPNTLAWCLVMRKGGSLKLYDVHYRPTN